MKVRRPLVWMAAAFLSGCLACRYAPVRWTIPAVVIWLLSGLGPGGGLFSSAEGKRPLFFLYFFLILFFLSGWSRMSYANRRIFIETTEYAGRDYQITAVIQERREGNRQTVYYLTEVILEDDEGRAYRMDRLYGRYRGEDHFCVGSTISCLGTAELFEPARNPGGFDSRAYWQAMGFRFQVQMEQVRCLKHPRGDWRERLLRLREALSERLARLLPEQEAAVGAAILLGEKKGLPEEIRTLYQENGIAHILAISGLHVSFLGMGLYRGLRRLGIPILICAAGGLIFLGLYGRMAGFPVSASRAVIMSAVSLTGQVFGRTGDLLNTAAVSAVLLLWNQPNQLGQTGFLLSYGAVLGIALLVPVWKNCHKKIPGSLCVSCAVQAAVLPVTMRAYSMLPLLGIILNLIVIPAMSLLLPLLAAALAADCFLRGTGRLPAGAAWMLLKLFETLCRGASSVPGSLLVTGSPALWKCLAYYGLLALSSLYLNRKKGRTGLFFLCIGFGLLFFPVQKQELTVTMLDVSQGEGILLEAPEGNFFLDGGSSDRPEIGADCLIPAVRSRGIRKLDWVMISHWDEDHINGIKTLLEENWLETGLVLLPGVGTEKGETEGLRQLKDWLEARKIPWAPLWKGMKIEKGRLKLRCLYPERGAEIRSPNEASLVLRLEYGSFSMLFTGDLEDVGETKLIREEGTSVTVLKIAHHGSGSSTGEEFLDWCAPKAAVISCGRNNRYGHPHPELLDRLRERRISFYVTAESGAILIRTNGKQWSIRGWLEEEDSPRQRAGNEVN